MKKYRRIALCLVLVLMLSLVACGKAGKTENTIKFITGTKSMDEYDEFVQSLYDYGIEECISYKQAALERYNVR